MIHSKIAQNDTKSSILMKYSQSAEDKRRKKNFRFCTKENNSGRSQRGEGEEGVCIKQLWCCLLCSTKKKKIV